jgi:hypothetical protein
MTAKSVILTKDDIDRAVDTIVRDYAHGKVEIIIEDGVILEVHINGGKRRVKGQLSMKLKEKP